MLRRGQEAHAGEIPVTVERYCAPESVAEAVALLASGGSRRLQAAPTCWCRCASRRVHPRRLSISSVFPAWTEWNSRRGGAYRRGDALLRAHGERGLARAVAGPAGGRRAHRFHAGAGSSQPRRQPVQRLARRGLGPGAGGQSRPGIDRGTRGERSVAAEAFPLGPGRTVLEAGEFVHAIELPRPAPRTADAYLRFIPRTEMDIAVAGAGYPHPGRKRRLHRCAHRARRGRAHRAAGAGGRGGLIGSRCDDAALDACAAAARAASRPITDRRGTAEFRRQVIGVLVRRAVLVALQRTAVARRFRGCSRRAVAQAAPSGLAVRSSHKGAVRRRDAAPEPTGCTCRGPRLRRPDREATTVRARIQFGRS